MNDKISQKLISGRYFMTIIAALVFGWMSINNQLDQQFVSDTIKLIVMFYFLKGNNENGK